MTTPRPRTLGTTSPLDVSALGLGCMGMSEFYGTPDEAGGIATIHRALDLGVTFLDTADMYGPFTNERLVGKAIAEGRPRRGRARHQVRQRAQRRRHSGSASTAGPTTSAPPATPRLQRLGVDHIDLYYQHRVDKTVPIEETVGAMEELVEAGKVPPPRALRGRRRDHPPRARRPPDHRPADRVLAVHPRPRGRDPPGPARARHRPGPLLAARPRHPHRRHHPAARSRTATRARRPTSRGSTARRSTPTSLLVEQVTRDRRREGLHARPARPGLGARPGRRRRRPIPGTKRVDLPRGERRRRRRRRSPPTTCTRIADAVPADAVVGDRYGDMSTIDA